MPAEKTVLAVRRSLHAAGLRATPSRIAVLGFVRESRRPVSHPDLVAAFTSRTWNRTTLYRNLLDLERAGLLRRTELGDHLWRFEAVGTPHPAADHPHFVCTECGQVQCLPGVEVSLSRVPSGPEALRSRKVEIQLRGCCDDCQ